MNDEQFKIFLERNEKSTAAAIKETVNGKIDRLTELMNAHNTKHEADMADIRPVIQAYNGFNSAGNLVKWIAGVATAVGFLWLLIKTLIKGQ